MAILRDERLILRPMHRRDRRFYARLYGNSSLMAHIGRPLAQHAARSSADATLAGMRVCPVGVRCWIIQLRPSRMRIGLAGWRPLDGGFELGAILLPRWQGQGLAVRALRWLCGVAMTLPGTARLLLRHRPGHLAAAAVCRALGFSAEAGGQDEHGNRVWTLTRDAWRADTSFHDEVS